MNDVNFDLSISLTVKNSDTIGPSTYDFLLVLNSNMCANPVRVISLQTLTDLDFDLSLSLDVRCDAMGLPIYYFLIVFISNVWLKSAPS